LRRRLTPRIFGVKETYTIKDSRYSRNADAPLLPALLAVPRHARNIVTSAQHPDAVAIGRKSMHARKLSDDEINKLMTRLPGWQIQNGKLHREFECKDFVTAFGNMTRVALIAESMNHHPEWFNVWNKVVIDLVTHSVKGISDLDFVLAEKVEEVFSGLLARQQKSGS
jgi:4a-hydroxytetrahydrobiopterin dehydratase